MYKTLFTLLSVALCSTAISNHMTISSEDVGTNSSEQTSKNNIGLWFSDNYTDFASKMYENETNTCPNLTRPGCKVKTTLNVMLKPCQVCVVKINGSCNPFLDPCEKGSLCLPESMENIDVNVCTEFTLEDYELLQSVADRKQEQLRNSKFSKKNKKHKNKKKCYKKKGKKCLKSQNKTNKLNKLNRLPKKFAKSKKPCKSHRRYLKKRKNSKSWNPYCTKDGFYSTTKKMCTRSKCWCVDKNGFYLKKVSKNSIKC